MAVTMLLSFFMLSPLGTQQDTSKTGIGALLLAGNLVIAKLTGDYFGLAAETNPLLHTWSLAVEEQFYLLFPAIIVAAWTIRQRFPAKRWIPAASVVAVGTLSLVWMLAGYRGLTLPREDWLIRFYSPFTRAWEFAVGVCLAMVSVRTQPVSARTSDALGLSGAGMLGLSFVIITPETVFPGPTTLLPVVGIALLLVAGRTHNSLTARVLSARPLVAIGDWSYSLYLWHWPLIVFASLQWPSITPFVAPLAAVFSFVPAVISYRWVESPLRSLPTPTPSRLLGMTAGVVIIPLVASVTLSVASSRGFGDPVVQTFQAATFTKATVGCKATVPLSTRRMQDCTWNSEATGPPIYLLGDSNAEHFGDGMVDAGTALRRPVVITTTNSCPFTGVPMTRSDWTPGRNADCRLYTSETLDFLEAASPGVVVISNTDSYWQSPTWVTPSTGINGQEDDKHEAFEDGLTKMTKRLQAAGHEVLIVQTIPMWRGKDAWRTETCGVTDIRETFCEQTMLRANAEARQAETRDVLNEVATITGARLYDPWPSLCDAETCSTQGPGYPRYYRDGIHLSVQQSRALAVDFVRVLS